MRFNTADDAANWLMSLKSKTDLPHFKAILDEMAIPYAKLPCIHVTGTNGKGSTINYLRHMLEAAGYTVGTFTSPYIICHQDRFCINGKMISDEDFTALVNRYSQDIEKYHLSMFESDVLLMLVYFLEKKVDLAMIEVGIGGRNDKTNVVHPMASVITNIGNDHLRQIGPTLADVAYQKAGIIKDHMPVYIGEMPADLQAVIAKEAALHHSELHVCHPPEADASLCFDYLGMNHLQLASVGAYQVKNACLAIQIIRDLFPAVSEEAIRTGLQTAVWPGRFEHFTVDGKDVYLDGAHNTDAFEALFDAVAKVKNHRQVTMIYAALKDKDYEKMAVSILDKGYVLRVCQFEDSRALTKDQAATIHAMAFDASIEAAIAAIKNIEGMIVVCGSLHFISQFRMKLLEKNCNLS